MVIGLGIDIVNKGRIAEIIKKNKKRFLERVLSQAEMNDPRVKEALESIDNAGRSGNKLGGKKTSNEMLVSHLAKRFAAKEAVAKAIGCGIGGTLSLKEIEITNSVSGAPLVVMNDAIISSLKTNSQLWDRVKSNEETERVAVKEKRLNISISISDEKESAVCMAILEYLVPSQTKV